MISGKLTVRYRTFYRVSAGGSAIKKRGQSVRGVKNRQPSQVRFHHCVEPTESRGAKSFFVEVGCRYGKRKKDRGGRTDFNRSPRCHVVSPTWISRQNPLFLEASSQIGGIFFLSSTPITSMSQHLWLRCEKKDFERRAALSPNIAKALIGAGFTIHVERDEQRIFDDSEYKSYAHALLTP